VVEAYFLTAYLPWLFTRSEA